MKQSPSIVKQNYEFDRPRIHLSSLFFTGIPEGAARRLRAAARPGGRVLPGHVLPRPGRAAPLSLLGLGGALWRWRRRPRPESEGGGAAALARRVRLQGGELRQRGEVLRRLRAAVPVHGVSMEGSAD